MQEAGHPQEIERTEEEGPEGACEFCEIGENCHFTSTRQSLATFRRKNAISETLPTVYKQKSVASGVDFVPLG